MSERTVTFQGNPLELAGTPVAVGDDAPDVELLDNGLGAVKLSSLKGKIAVLLSVPSLDTPVCDVETRRFNTEAAALGDDVAVVAISADLPFAQGRWCGAAGIENVQTLSDHHATAFGQAYGVLLPALRLLTRAVFVVDKNGDVAYVQVVPEITDEPDYDAALAAVKALQ
jgi:thiol peroxidase